MPPDVHADALSAFLRVIHPAETGFHELRALPGKAQTFVPVGDVAGVATFLAAHAHENVYYGCAVRRTTLNGTLENCSELHVAWVDLDFRAIAEAEARTRLGTFPIPPHVIVHSGGGLHAYWRLREPFQLPTDADAAQSLNTRLQLHFGSDPGATDPARVLRPPTSHNHKYDPPRDVVLERLDDGAANVSELTEWLPPEPKRPNGSTGAAPFAVPEKIRAGARNDLLYKAARSLHAAHWSPAAMRAALTAENLEKCAPALPQSEVDDIAAHAATQRDRPDFSTVNADDIIIETPAPDPTVGLDPAFLTDAVDVIREGQQIAAHGIRYTVEGIIPAYGMLGMLVAFTKVGKTTLGQAMAAAVAMGRPFLDRATTQTRVLYLAAEDPPEYTAYLARVLSVEEGRFTFYRAPLRLTVDGLRAIHSTITAGAYGLVLIASWQAVIRGLVKDENDNAGMVNIVETVKTFTRQTAIPWLIDAHSGKGEDQDDDADPSRAMRGASGAAGAADYTLSLRYSNGAFGTQRRFSGKGRFVNVSPVTIDLNLEDGAYTLIGNTKHAAAETTWRLIRELGAIDGTPRSVTEIARTVGLVADGERLSGSKRRHVTAALRDRPGVLMSQELRRGQAATLYRWEPV